ncbi:HSF-type DNA-binding-domain-containing protein [Cubamyces menziesii]|nr:HSF-type DNA-binding-domain-containing protein [Cubamyces menziesii]
MSADLYPQSAYSARPSYQQRADQPYQLSTPSNVVYPPQLLSSQQQQPQQPQTSSLSDAQSAHSNEAHSQSPQRESQSPKQEDNASIPKQEGAPQQQPAKPQATFLTKLYALLERPENHHMIRWDPAGEHIIVERPEQLALHVLPSVYRQSRFASFSRQLNIYGFMRKVNLRNVDPAIDDPDASTWSHPTLNRHSPPEVVANFKRRVPPRLPKPRKRDNEVAQIPPPRSAIGMGPVPLSVAAADLSQYKGGRSRGFSAPGSFTPISQPGAAGWGTSYPRATLPPLNVPSDPPSLSSHGSMYTHSSHTLHPVTPTEDTQSPSTFGSMNYSATSRESMMLPSPTTQYQYSDQQSTWFSQTSATSPHSASGSLSSLLNPSSNMSSGYSNTTRPQPAAINTAYTSSYPPMGRSHHSAGPGPVSPDSRPTSGYSASSMSSLPTPYEDTSAHHFSHHDYSRPGSGHHRPMSPSSSRPPSSKSYSTTNGSLSVRRERRHSQAMSPYPSPYGEHPSHRPSTSPHPADDHTGSTGIPRVRSMIQLPSVDSYSFTPSQADFAYAPVDDSGHGGHTNGMYGGLPPGSRSVRPSTSASSLSTTSSAANTPGGDGYGAGAGDADITRCE